VLVRWEPGHQGTAALGPGPGPRVFFYFYFFIFLGVLFFHEKKDTRDLVREPGKLTNRGSPVFLSVLFHGPVYNVTTRLVDMF
jgi:hypothetical protein